jgi:hypothetical protein
MRRDTAHLLAIDMNSRAGAGEAVGAGGQEHREPAALPGADSEALARCAGGDHVTGSGSLTPFGWRSGTVLGNGINKTRSSSASALAMGCDGAPRVGGRLDNEDP